MALPNEGKPDASENPENALPQIFLPSDRQLSRGMGRAAERIAEGEYAQAIRFLDDILREEQEDFFLPADKVGGEFQGGKQRARQIIRDLPEEGKALYRALYGPVARRELEQARIVGNIDAIRRIAFRYFHTEAGQEAALLLAQNQTDLGHFVSAALIYEELRSTESAQRFEPQLSLLAAECWIAAGDREKAAAVLRALGERGDRVAQLGGEKIRLRDLDSSPLKWLEANVGLPANSERPDSDEWLTFRGSSGRNAHAQGGLPHMRERWAVRLLSHPDLEELHDTLSSQRIRHKRSMAVATTPLAVGNYVITRSAHNLLAVDYQTGKRVWRSQPQRVSSFEQVTAKSTQAAQNSAEPSPIQALNERIWDDSLYGSYSSDGERVYVIRDLSPPASQQQRNIIGGFGLPINQAELDTLGTNRLCAYELSSQGKLVWEIDGAKSDAMVPGAFFLGAPVWIGEALYGLAEIKSAVYLVAIDHETGALQWQQQLVGLEANIQLDRQRRLQAVMPSYDSGMLICPTGAGVVVGIDLGKRALRWAYRYRTNRGMQNLLRGRIDRKALSRTQWSDAGVVVEAGRLILSPPESGELHCLDLVTGQPLWKRKRGNALWVAGVSEGQVLLVGNSELMALSLADGKPSWPGSKVPMPAGAVPSGRGFFSEGQYFLPLSSAEVVAIDMRTGEISSRASSRDGRVLGNLICHRGSVLSQTGSVLECYDLVDVLRDKAENALLVDAEDLQSLRVLGEIAYNEGRLEQAIEFLERAHARDSDDTRTKDVLIECLQVALSDNFASYRDRLPLLQGLIRTTGSGDSHLLRLEAEGLLASGDVRGSFDACMQLYETKADLEQPAQLDRAHEATWARWLQRQTKSIWDKASAEQRSDIEESLLGILARVQAKPTLNSLEHFAESFGSLGVGELALFQLAEQHLAQEEDHIAQQIYLRLMESADEPLRAASVARCSQILHERGLKRLAGSFDKLLKTELADIKCLDGKTGSECLAQWDSEGELQAGLDWPTGEVEVAPVTSTSRRPSRHLPSSRIRLERTDGVLGPCSVVTSTRTQGRIRVRDSVGTNFFSAEIDDPRKIQIHDISNLYGVSRGNLLIVSQGNRIVAFNTLAGVGAADEKLLWKHDVVQSIQVQGQYQYRVVMARQNTRRIAPSKAPRSKHEDQWIGVIGPVTHDSCVFQNQRQLICVDPITGEQKWARTDVPPGCDLFGDGEYVVAVPPSSDEALLFSTVDGRSLGSAEVPRWEEQLATLGRKVIRWRKVAEGELELSSFDVAEGKSEWSQRFAAGSRVDITQGRYVAIAEPDKPSGLCHIFDAATGEHLVVHELQLAEACRQIHIMAGSDSFLVATERYFKPSLQRNVQTLNNWDYRVIDGGIYLFDRKTGEPIWERPVEVKQESLMLSQPVDLPVIAFAGTVHHRTRSGGRPHTSLLLLEKSSGRVLYYDDKLPQSGGNYCALRLVDQDEAEMEVEMASRTVRLKFTDRPRPAEPPAVVGGGPAESEESGGLLGIAKKLLEQ